MNILYFSTDNSKASGAFRVLVELSKNLQKEGHNVLVILPYMGSGTKLLESNGIKNKTIFTFSWIKHTYFNPWDYISHYLFMPNNFIAEKRIKKVIKEFKPNIAIVNTVYSYVGAKCCLDLGVPYLWCFKEFIREHSHKTWYSMRYASYLMNNASKIICASKGVKEAHKDFIEENKMMHIYEGVDSNRFLNENKKVFLDKKIHFINVGRIKKAKGQYLIIEALNKLKDVDFDLTLVGYYHKLYKNKLMKQCNFKENIHFIGEVSDVNKYLSKADIFIMPSTNEAFGLVTVEAALAGLCLIGSNSTGTKEILGVLQGNIFKNGDSNSLYENIVSLLKDKEKFIDNIKINQDLASSNFSSKNNTDRFIEVLEKYQKDFK